MGAAPPHAALGSASARRAIAPWTSPKSSEFYLLNTGGTCAVACCAKFCGFFRCKSGKRLCATGGRVACHLGRCLHKSGYDDIAGHCERFEVQAMVAPGRSMHRGLTQTLRSRLALLDPRPCRKRGDPPCVVAICSFGVRGKTPSSSLGALGRTALGCDVEVGGSSVACALAPVSPSLFIAVSGEHGGASKHVRLVMP